MFPAVVAYGGGAMENKTKIRHVSTSTTIVRGNGADGLETIFAGNDHRQDPPQMLFLT